MTRGPFDNETWRREQLRGRLHKLNRQRFEQRSSRRDPEQQLELCEEIGAIYQQLGEAEHALGAWGRAFRYLPAGPKRVARLAELGRYAAGLAKPGRSARGWAAVHAWLAQDEQARRNGVLPARRAKSRAALHERLLQTERGANGHSYRLLCEYAGIEPVPVDREPSTPAGSQSRERGSGPREGRATPARLKGRALSLPPRSRLANSLLQLVRAADPADQPLAAVHLMACLASSASAEDDLSRAQLSSLEKLSATPCSAPPQEAQRLALGGALVLLASQEQARRALPPLEEFFQAPPEPTAGLVEVRAGLGALLDALASEGLGGPSTAARDLATALDWLYEHAGALPEIAEELRRAYQRLGALPNAKRTVVVTLAERSRALLDSADVLALLTAELSGLALSDWELVGELLEERGTDLPDELASAAVARLGQALDQVSEFSLPLLRVLWGGYPTLAASLRSSSSSWNPYPRALVALAFAQVQVARDGELGAVAVEACREIAGLLRGVEQMRVLTRLLVCAAALPANASPVYARLEELHLELMDRTDFAGVGPNATDFLANEFALAVVAGAELRANRVPEERARFLSKIQGCVRFALARLDRLEPAPLWVETAGVGTASLERAGVEEPRLFANATRIAGGLLQQRDRGLKFAGARLALATSSLSPGGWSQALSQLGRGRFYALDLQEVLELAAAEAQRGPLKERSARVAEVAALACRQAAQSRGLGRATPELVLNLGKALVAPQP